MPAVIVDTGPLIAAFDPNDQYHLRAQLEQETLANRGVGVFVTIQTLFEAYTLILRRVNVGTAHGWLDETRRQVGTAIPNESETDAAIELVQRYRDQPLRFSTPYSLLLREVHRLPCGHTTTIST